MVANKTEDAFKLAQTHSLVDTYCTIIGDQIGNEEALKVAQYYEKNDFGKSGRQLLKFTFMFLFLFLFYFYFYYILFYFIVVFDMS